MCKAFMKNEIISSPKEFLNSISLGFLCLLFLVNNKRIARIDCVTKKKITEVRFL